MSLAIRHPFTFGPLAPAPQLTQGVAAFKSMAARRLGLRPLRFRHKTAKPPRPLKERERPSVFHRLAASDLAFRDVAAPLFGAYPL